KHRRRVTGGVQPGSTENLTPPGRLTNRRGHRLQLWGQQTCKNQRIPMNLSICMVPGVLNKDRKFSVSDRGGRNSERGHPDFTHRPLAIFGVSFRGFTAHQKRGTLQSNHAQLRCCQGRQGFHCFLRGGVRRVVLCWGRHCAPRTTACTHESISPIGCRERWFSNET